jgi:prepilin-type N-terminal cleavage/methylation domain-containing protein
MLTPSRRPAGFTLVEMLVALVLSAIVSLAVVGTFVHSGRSFQGQLATVRLGQQTRGAAYVLSAALRDLDATDSDIVEMSDSDMTLKATQQIGFICVAPTKPYASVSVQTSRSYGRRAFAALDSALVFADNDTTTSKDDAWIRATISNVGTGTCTNGKAATTLTLAVSPNTDSIYMGAPVRSFELDRLALFQDVDGREYLGKSRLVNGAWTPLDPVAGPFAPAGVALTYYDTTGTVTTSPQAVSEVGIAVRGQGLTPATQAGTLGKPQRDSVITLVAVRNNRHS